MDMRIAAALAALLLAGPVRAQDSKPADSKDSVMTFLRNLKLSLAQTAVQGERKKQRAGSVAAVRGKDQSSELSDPNEPTLKGDVRAAKARQNQAEDVEFEKALDLVLAGKADDGIKALEVFKSKHPKSHSLERVQEAIDKAKTLAAESPSADKPADKPASTASKKGQSKG